MKHTFLKKQKWLLLIFALGTGCTMQLKGTENETELESSFKKIVEDLDRRFAVEASNATDDMNTQDPVTQEVADKKNILEQNLAKLDQLNIKITQQSNTTDLEATFKKEIKDEWLLDELAPGLENCKHIPRIADIDPLVCKGITLALHPSIKLIDRKLDIATKIGLTKMFWQRARCAFECALQLLNNPNKIDKDTETYIENVKKNIFTDNIEKPSDQKPEDDIVKKQTTLREQVSNALWSFESVTLSTFWLLAIHYIVSPRLGLNSGWDKPAVRLINSVVPVVDGILTHGLSFFCNDWRKIAVAMFPLSKALVGPQEMNHYAAAAGHLFNIFACGYLYNHG